MTDLKEKLKKRAAGWLPDDKQRYLGNRDMLDLLWPVIAAAQEAKEYAECDDVNGYAGAIMHNALAELERAL